MPTIAIIDGVAIILWNNDQTPPHFHAKSAGFHSKVSIETGEVLDGDLPKAKLKRIRTWLDANRDEIAYAWDELRAGRAFKGRIG
jgi:hypothetical protein